MSKFSGLWVSAPRADDVWEYPVGVGLCGPAVDEETDGDEDGGGDHHGESVFGTTYTVSFF